MITFLIHFFFLIQSLPQIKQAFCSGGQLTPLENIKRNTSISRTWKKKEVFKFVNVKIGVFQCISMLFCVLSVEYIKSHCWFLQSPKNSYCNNRMWLELFLGWPHPRSRTPKDSSQIKQPSWAVTSGHTIGLHHTWFLSHHLTDCAVSVALSFVQAACLYRVGH